MKKQKLHGSRFDIGEIVCSLPTSITRIKSMNGRWNKSVSVTAFGLSWSVLLCCPWHVGHGVNTQAVSWYYYGNIEYKCSSEVWTSRLRLALYKRIHSKKSLLYNNYNNQWNHFTNIKNHGVSQNHGINITNTMFPKNPWHFTCIETMIFLMLRGYKRT